MDINSRKFILTIIIAIISAILIIYPQIDLQIQQLFWDNNSGFFLKNNQYVIAIYKLIPKLTMAFTISIFMLWIILWIIYKKFWDSKRKKMLYLLLCLLIGPGLFVNTIFKDNFGRARPSQIMEFGGEKSFSRAFSITSNCLKNCSFVSGHASVGFYFSAISFITAGIISSLFFYGAIILGLIIGMVRISQGGHFFSDVFFSGMVVIIVNYFIYLLMFNFSKKSGKSGKNNNS
jgi:lipid A 4'-phosphatase